MMWCHLGQLHQVENWPRKKFTNLQGTTKAIQTQEKRRALGLRRLNDLRSQHGGHTPHTPKKRRPGRTPAKRDRRPASRSNAGRARQKNGAQVGHRQEQNRNRRPEGARAEQKAGAQVGHRLEQKQRSTTRNRARGKADHHR